MASISSHKILLLVGFFLALSAPPSGGHWPALTATSRDLPVHSVPCTVVSPSVPTATVTGVVVDSATFQPVENANAFLSGTTFGTSSDAKGRFTLRTALTGGFDLVVSRVGYGRSVSRIQLVPGDSIFLRIPLPPLVLLEEPVQITAGVPEEWKKHMALFQKKFMGDGEYADNCRILNPFVIDFAMHGDTLIASSDSLIWVENPDLGYTMGILIRKFAWDTDADQGVWAVYALFRDSAVASPDQSKIWSEHRRKVYEGSLRHFLWSLIRRRTFEEGFEIRAGRYLEYSSRWGRTRESTIALIAEPWTRLFRWNYAGWIRVDNPSYSAVPSFIRPVEDVALVDSIGNMVTPLAFLLGGKWEWERAGNLLPADYTPPDTP